MSSLATAARIYFDASDNATAHGKTREEFEMSCTYVQHCRNQLRKALEEYENATITTCN